MKLPASFIKDGLEEVKDECPRRLLLGTDGLERTGKTDFALDTPGPIAYFGLDFGHEGVIEKWAKTKAIGKYIVNIPPISNQNQYLAIWQKVHEKYMTVIRNKDVRTAVVDTASDMWELLRLAEFGQLSPAADIKRAYQPVNQMYKSIVRAAYDRSDLNLILIHKVKKEYAVKKVSSNRGVVEQEVWNGNYERAGFGQSGYLIQANIRHVYDFPTPTSTRKEFGIQIVDCRQNMDIAGMTLWGSDARFAVLAQYIFPDSSPEDWQ